MILEVVVDISNDSVDRIFDYSTTFEVSIGQWVLVPFGNRKLTGIVVGKKDSTHFLPEKIKPIIKVMDNMHPLSEEMLSLSLFLQEKFFLRRNDIFKLMFPNTIRRDNAKLKTIVYFSVVNYDKEDAFKIIGNRSKQQLKCYLYLLDIEKIEKSKITKLFDMSIINNLIKKGVVKSIEESASYFDCDDVFEHKPISLNTEQQYAVDTILGAPKTYLLHGVTGSGKTEVYLNIIEECLKNNKTAIMLVPEISLTPQMLGRFKSRLGNTVALLHSRLTPNEKYEEWMRLSRGEAKVVLGARSAIFCPLENLGVIIIDEEHDNSYISDNNPRYETEEVATFRAQYNNAPLILGSATPKITTYKKAIDEEIGLITLKNRALASEMPKIEIVDMIAQIADGNASSFSTNLLKAMQDTINNKKQIMLFVNRRGYTSFMMCRECGYIAKCTDCEVSLVYHKEDEQLKCHFCGKRYKALTNCPNCKSSYLRYGATGTQKIVEELKDIFPNIPVFRMDNDNTKGKNSHKDILNSFSKNSPSILVGTQMIAKGHDFPNVALVGIIDADVSLYNSDYRSTENTFQLMTQVAGRAGRKSNDGKVILQTYSPKHYVYRLAANYDYFKFFEHEINIRQTTQFPPFSSIIRILISSENEDSAKKVVRKLLDDMLPLKQEYKNKIILMQGMPAPVKRIQKKFRYQILIRYLKDENITCAIHDICDIIPEGKVSIFIEHNPQNLR